MYLSGIGKVAIAKRLNEEGVKNRFGEAKWSPAGIGKIIRNEKYCGDLKLQKTYTTNYISKKTVPNNGEHALYYVKDAHDGIIDKETFCKVQAEIERRTSRIKLADQSAIVHSPFSGLIVCAHCGKHFGRHTENAGTKYSKPAWSCLTSVTFGKEYCPMGQKSPEDILKQKTCEALGLEGLDESIVREQIKEIIVPKAFTLIYVFKNGTEKEVAWQHRSRRESWTPEMKESARQRTIAQHEAKKRKGDSNGS